MITNNPEYQSYVLRLWVAHEAERRVWRASLQSIPSGARRGFAELGELVGFLEAQIQPPPTAGQQASLQSIPSGARWGFPELGELVGFLEAQIQPPPAADQPSDDGSPAGPIISDTTTIV